MYKCKDCGLIRKDFEKLSTTYEDYYGADQRGSTKVPLVVIYCPRCDSDAVEEYDYATLVDNYKEYLTDMIFQDDVLMGFVEEYGLDIEEYELLNEMELEIILLD